MVTYADHELQAAWANLRKSRTHWPPVFEDVMRTPHMAVQVRAEAMRRRKCKPKPLPTLKPLPAFDPKRAAAGDLDKDD